MIPGACDDREFALARFHQDPALFSCPAGGWVGGCGGADILVPFAANNQPDLLDWLDLCDNYGDCVPSPGSDPPGFGCSLCGDCGSGCDKELRPTGSTPIAGALSRLYEYLSTDVIPNDPDSASRPYSVVVITDGDETCGGNPATAATALCDLGVSVVPIGFAAGCTMGCAVEAIAAAGCGPNCLHSGCDGEALFAENEEELERALLGVCAPAVDGGTPVDAGIPLRCEPHTQGFWKRQCAGPHPSGEHERLPDYIDAFNDALTFAGVADVGALCDRLNPAPENDKCEQAEAQLGALLLNLASGRVSSDCCVASDVTTAGRVGDAVTEADALLASAGRTFQDCVRAQEIAASINEGRVLCDPSAAPAAEDAGATDGAAGRAIGGEAASASGAGIGPLGSAPADAGPERDAPTPAADVHSASRGCAAAPFPASQPYPWLLLLALPLLLRRRP